MGVVIAFFAGLAIWIMGIYWAKKKRYKSAAAAILFGTGAMFIGPVIVIALSPAPPPKPLSKGEFQAKAQQIKKVLDRISRGRDARGMYVQASAFEHDFDKCDLASCRATRRFVKKVIEGTADGFVTPREDEEFRELAQEISRGLTNDQARIVESN